MHISRGRFAIGLQPPTRASYPVRASASAAAVEIRGSGLPSTDGAGKGDIARDAQQDKDLLSPERAVNVHRALLDGTPHAVFADDHPGTGAALQDDHSAQTPQSTWSSSDDCPGY